MSTTNPLLRYALQLGFTIAAGSKHWHATHPGGGRAIIPFGRTRHPRSDRNIEASLRRASRTAQHEVASRATSQRQKLVKAQEVG